MRQLTPREIVAELDLHIVGQQDAKRAVAIAVRNRWRRQQLPEDLRMEISPKNILMIGPTGVGKTEIARRLAKMTNAPFVKVEATKYTEVGYYGRDVESMIRDLVESAISLVRSSEREKIQEKAEKKVEERLLDLLVPLSAKDAEPPQNAGSSKSARKHGLKVTRRETPEGKELHIKGILPKEQATTLTKMMESLAESLGILPEGKSLKDDPQFQNLLNEDYVIKPGDLPPEMQAMLEKLESMTKNGDAENADGTDASDSSVSASSTADSSTSNPSLEKGEAGKASKNAGASGNCCDDGDVEDEDDMDFEDEDDVDDSDFDDSDDEDDDDADSDDDDEAVSESARKLAAELRESLRAQLKRGELENRVVQLTMKKKAPSPFMMINGGNDMLDSEMSGLFDKILPHKSVQREMTVKEARRVLLDAECDAMIDEEKVHAAAVEMAENTGIIFLDEIDKIVASEGTRNADVSRQGVQRDLLPIVEGTTVQTRYGYVKTDHILFIAAGAFHRNKPSDLMPELQGRFPIRVELKDLTQEDFAKILREPKNSLPKQYEALLKTEGVEVVFEDDAIEALAAYAWKVNQTSQNIGARRLYTILERLLEELSFEASEIGMGRVVINAAYVRQRLQDVSEDEDLSRYIL